MSTIDEARPSADNLQQRLDFETLVSDLSSRFINLRAGEVDREIEDALRRVCEPLGIDLAMLWQWSDLAPGVATATHVYTRARRTSPRTAAPGTVSLARAGIAGRPHRGPVLAGGASGRGRRRPRKRRLHRHQVESGPAPGGGGESVHWHPGSQHRARGARLAGRAGEAAAAGGAGLHQRARPRAPGAQAAAKPGAPGGECRSRRPGVLRGGLRRRRRPRRRPLARPVRHSR